MYSMSTSFFIYRFLYKFWKVLLSRQLYQVTAVSLELWSLLREPLFINFR